MWWCPEKADTRRKYRVLVLGCLRWGLHGPGCVPLTLSSGQDSIWYGLQSWALCIPFEGSMLMYDIVFYSGKVMGELRIQLYRLSTMCTITVKMAVQHFYWLWIVSLFIQQWSLLQSTFSCKYLFSSCDRRWTRVPGICFTYMEIEFSKFAHSVHTCYLLCLFYVNNSLLISFLIPWLIKSNRISMGTGDTLEE